MMESRYYDSSLYLQTHARQPHWKEWISHDPISNANYNGEDYRSSKTELTEYLNSSSNSWFDVIGNGQFEKGLAGGGSWPIKTQRNSFLARCTDVLHSLSLYKRAPHNSFSTNVVHINLL